MKDRKSYLLAMVGIVSLVASLTLNIARAGNTAAAKLPAATAHFLPGRVYLLSPANGAGGYGVKVRPQPAGLLRGFARRFRSSLTATLRKKERYHYCNWRQPWLHRKPRQRSCYCCVTALVPV